MTVPMPHLFTGEEYDNLPEDNVRRQLVDGVLVVSPSPSQHHQTLAMELGVALRRSVPRALFRVTQAVEVKLSDRVRYIPDVLAVKANADNRRRSQYLAHEVVLAVEIESPSSTALDRILKPAHYAAAGIPYYWRIELDDEPTLVAYMTDGDTYKVTNTFVGEVGLDAPWPVQFDLSELLG